MATPTAIERRILTVPNLITVMRLACIPVFWWLLLAKDDRAAAAWLLGALGATDWVDGWVARRFNQVSDLGKVLDPTADRILFLTCLIAIIIDGGVPTWLCVVVIVREALVGGAMVVATAMGMQRFDVQWVGKAGTFGLMWAFPLLLMGSAGDAFRHDLATFLGWVCAVPGLFFSFYAAVTYIPLMRQALAEGRKARQL
ncbi:MAG TPA: CDP-alcohol phosphatidyltransferase family protein [Acidimicrobiales bacterium]